MFRISNILRSSSTSASSAPALIDILANKPLYTKLHVHGSVELLDCMPRLVQLGQTADNSIAECARVSYSKGTTKVSNDTNLIRRLMRDYHTSPFESVEFKFRVKVPIFIWRQWIRHRTANINEISGRYSVLDFMFRKIFQNNPKLITKDQMVK